MDGIDGLSWLKSAPSFCPLGQCLCSLRILKEIILGDYLLPSPHSAVRTPRTQILRRDLSWICTLLPPSGEEWQQHAKIPRDRSTKSLQPAFILKRYFKDHGVLWNRYPSVFLTMYFPSHILNFWERIAFWPPVFWVRASILTLLITHNFLTVLWSI